MPVYLPFIHEQQFKIMSTYKFRCYARNAVGFELFPKWFSADNEVSFIYIFLYETGASIKIKSASKEMISVYLHAVQSEATNLQFLIDATKYLG